MSAKKTVNRDEKGKFVKGNKSGGRKKIPADIKEALTKLTPRAVERLEEIINMGKDERIVMDAVKVVFDRVYGKPLQQAEVKTEGTLNIVLNGEVEEWSK